MSEIVAPPVSGIVNHTIKLNFLKETKNIFTGGINITKEERELLSFVFDIVKNSKPIDNIETLFQYKNSSCLYQYSRKNEQYYIYVVRNLEEEKCEYNIVKNNMGAFTKSDGKVLHDFLKKHFRINSNNEYEKRPRVSWDPTVPKPSV